MATIQRFEDIESWKTARQMTRTVYELSRQGEFARDSGLRDQMRCVNMCISCSKQIHAFIAYLKAKPE
ncbi:MAG: hypothetical protein KatS3mg053_3330 [Candidatus Roseilinea sp.]|nr:MAG: hypothetical protein KatS3mg053_3330 [Candidatus Roseilinea sp.]